MSMMERLAFTGRRETPSRTATREENVPSSARRATAAPERDRLAFNGLIAFMLLLLVRPQDQFPFLTPLHLAELTGGFAFLALIIGRLARGAVATRTPRELIVVLAFAAVMVGTVPFSFWPGGSMAVFTEQFAKIVAVFVVMVNTLTTRKRIEQFVTVVVFGATYVGMRAAIDYVRGANLVEGGRVAGAVGGLFGNPNDMALNMVAFLPFGIGFALDRSRPRARLLGLMSIPAMTVAIVVSQSRGGTIGLLVMLGVLLMYLRRTKPTMVAAIVVAGLAALPLLPGSFTQRMTSIFVADQDPTGSREARKTLLREGWHVFLEHPLLGIGAGQFTNYNPESRQEAWRQTHNAPLQVASELGILGLLPFGCIVWWGFSAGLEAVRVGRRTQRSEPQAPARGTRRPHSPRVPTSDGTWLELSGAMVVASMTGWFVAALFASVAYYWTLYLVLGIAAGVREVSLTLAPSSRSRYSTRALPLRAA